ncbi:unnamed protein product [Mytilus coruscus]|uniref:Uncharacterized protein n=1 Tax=Mytilus coruscus TaxID=42192 RepID=A0A6J8ABA5_MYTCO|nr:unnamed protein product [Mytilus coruscus]
MSINLEKLTKLQSISLRSVCIKCKLVIRTKCKFRASSDTCAFLTSCETRKLGASCDYATMNPSAIAFVSQNVNTGNVTGRYVQIEAITKSPAQQISLSRLPLLEPSVFHGDPLKYPAWKSSFQTITEQRKIPQFERIHYLRKYVGDSVREVIESFLVFSTEDAYDDEKELLERRYGDPFIISNAARDRLEN